MTFDLRSRRAFLFAAVGALLWALALVVTGGFVIETPWRAITSRNATRPFFAGLAALAWYLLVWRRHWRSDLGRLARPASWPLAIALVAMLVALVVGIGWGTRIGGGPDQSGYASQGALLARGRLTMQAPEWSSNAPWDDAAYTASPVGWRPTPQTHILMPTYSPGLPLCLAIAERLAGPAATFYVVPVFGALLVWSTYAIGVRLSGPWAGAIAGTLAVSSPTFLLMQQQVMSDVPVAAFLAASIAASLRADRAWLAGAAAGAALLVRPNLVPLVAFPFALVLLDPGARVRRAAAFALPVCVAAAAVGGLNWFYNGSPLVSGYGNLASFYSAAAIPQNARLYSRWMFSTHTPIFLAGALAPFVAAGDWRQRTPLALVTLGLPFVMLLLFLPFLVFHENDWGYTRFLIPGYTGLAVGCGVVAMSIVERASRGRAAVAIVALIVASAAAFGWTFSVRNGVFLQRLGDHRFAQAVEYVRRLPARSILVSNSHSGTLRFYSGRDILRFETVPPEEIDIAVAYLLGKDYHLFFVGDEFEIEQFQTRFAGRNVLARLARKPRAAFSGVVVYDIR